MNNNKTNNWNTMSMNEIQKNINCDGLVGFDTNTKEHEMMIESKVLNDGNTSVITIPNKHYRLMKKACRRGNTTTINTYYDGKTHNVRKVGKERYMTSDNIYVLNAKSLNNDKVVRYIPNQNSVTGSCVYHNLKNETSVNDGLTELLPVLTPQTNRMNYWKNQEYKEVA